MPEAVVLSIQVGMPKVLRHEDFPDDVDREWSSGIFKQLVEGPVYVGLENLEGDGQADRAHHGGEDRATLMFSHLHYDGWEKDLGKALPPGAFGENLTVDSLTEDDVCLGDIWESDHVRFEVSQPRIPCYKLSRRIGAEGLHLKVMDAMAGGWYCRTIQPGVIQAGDTIRLADRPHPEWPVRRAFQEFVFGKENERALTELGNLKALSLLWSERIPARLEKLRTAG